MMINEGFFEESMTRLLGYGGAKGVLVQNP